MTERKYSVAEIDRMRSAIRSICTPSGSLYREADKMLEVEEQLRTCMLNGTDPDELDQMKRELWEEEERVWEQNEELRRQMEPVTPASSTR